jgi:ribosomal protein L29
VRKTPKIDYLEKSLGELERMRDKAMENVARLRFRSGAMSNDTSALKTARKELARTLTFYNRKLKLERGSGREG